MTETLSEKRRRAALSKPRLALECEWCGDKFQGLSTAKFCSNRCRQANKYDKVRRARR